MATGEDEERLTLKLRIFDHVFDTPCWEEVAAAQLPPALEQKHIIDSPLGTVFAFMDRNNLSQPLERRIFVVRGDDNNIFLFHSDGTVLDEPDAFTAGGVQRYGTSFTCTHPRSSTHFPAHQPPAH